MAKKTISGKQYNTEKATYLGSWSIGLSEADPNYIREDFYKKRTGEYFLSCEGGPSTKYAKANGDLWVSGSMIMPLSYEAAKKWAKEKLDSEKYDAIFGAISDDYESKETLFLTVSAAAYDKLDRAVSARGNGATKSSIIEELITSMDI